MEVIIKLCDVSEIIPVRHQVLRQGKPIETCSFHGDDLSSTIHIGAYYDKNTIGCVSLMKNDNSKFQFDNQYQLRGMAVLEAYRSLKIGNQLLSSVEHELIKKRVELIWCNVRLTAQGFYTNNGFKSLGETFEISHIGPHITMYKALIHE